MAAVIGRGKNCVGRVFALKHPGRMRDPNQKHGVLAELGGDVLHRAAGMLFEHVVDVLNAGHVALANAIHAFVKPADPRAMP